MLPELSLIITIICARSAKNDNGVIVCFQVCHNYCKDGNVFSIQHLLPTCIYTIVAFLRSLGHNLLKLGRPSNGQFWTDTVGFRIWHTFYSHEVLGGCLVR